MAKIGILEPLYEYDYVGYYTVRLEVDEVREEYSETEKFILNFEDPSNAHYAQYDTIVRVIDAIGNRSKGAELNLFRFEDAAHALPPKVRHGRDVLDIEILLHSELRLYCIRLTNGMVILLNGDVKTQNFALDCPNVKPHFRFAQAVAKAVDQLMKERVIEIRGKEIINLTDEEEILLYL
jgi:hypothetical protein